VVQYSKQMLRLVFWSFWTKHTIWHTNTHTAGRTPLYEWSARPRGRYTHDTQQTQETNIHALSGIL